MAATASVRGAAGLDARVSGRAVDGVVLPAAAVADAIVLVAGSASSALARIVVTARIDTAIARIGIAARRVTAQTRAIGVERAAAAVTDLAVAETSEIAAPSAFE